MDNKELLEYLIGPGSVAKLLGAVIYAAIGALLMLLLSANKRNPLSKKSPVHFSWDYLLDDNSKRILATILLIFIFIRFSREIIGADITMYLALGIGLGCDRLGKWIQSINILGKGLPDTGEAIEKEKNSLPDFKFTPPPPAPPTPADKVSDQ